MQIYLEAFAGAAWNRSGLQVGEFEAQASAILKLSVMSFAIAVQPPQNVQRDEFFSSPLAIVVNINNDRYEMTDLCAVATLIDATGEPIEDGIGGSYTESAQLLPNESSPSDIARGYILFENLKIMHLGIFRIRLTILDMASSKASNGSATSAASLAQFDTNEIDVEDEPARAHSLCEYLRTRDLYIPC